MTGEQPKSHFASWLGYKAGAYDGQRTKLGLDAAHLAYVGAHESIHERVCTGFPDGRLAFYAAHLRIAPKLSQVDQRNVESNRELLLKHSERAHEVFATCLGEHLLSPEEAKGVIAMLPDPYYPDYYNAIGLHVKNATPSSFFQYALAWGVCGAVFSSPLCEEVTPLDLLDPLDESLVEQHSPTLRLAHLESFGMDALIRQLVAIAVAVANDASSELGTWDLHDDDAWALQDVEGRTDLENRLFLRLSEHVSSTTRLPVCDAALAERWAYAASAVTHSVDPDTVVLGAHRHADVEGLVHSPNEILNWHQCASFIQTNHRNYPKFLVPDFLPLPPSEDDTKVFIRRKWDRADPSWLGFNIGPRSASDPHVCSEEFVRTERAARTRGDESSLMFVMDSVPSHVTLRSTIAQTRAKLGPFKHPLDDIRSIYYVHGHWGEAFLQLFNWKERLLYAIYADTDSQFPTGFAFSMPPRYHVMVVPGVPILFARAFNPVASSLVRSLIFESTHAARIQPLSSEMTQTSALMYGQLLHGMLGLAEKMWPTL